MKREMWRYIQKRNKWEKTQIGLSYRIQEVSLLIFREDELTVGIPKEAKTAMKADLHDLIVSVLRKYPGLSYFQVSHSDIWRHGLMIGVP